MTDLRTLNISVSSDELRAYTVGQLEQFFPDGNRPEIDKAIMDETLARVEKCFGHVFDRYFQREGSPYFNHLHADQYAAYLYFLGNTIYKREGHHPTASKLFLLNRALNGLDAFYAIELPDIFMFSHPIGTILGRAKYDDFLVIYQGVTVGSNHDVDYPTLGRHVCLYRNSAVLGASRIGNHCKLAAGATVMDQDVPGHHIFIGDKRHWELKPSKHDDYIWSSRKPWEQGN